MYVHSSREEAFLKRAGVLDSNLSIWIKKSRGQNYTTPKITGINSFLPYHSNSK